jgi:sugar O-acyltransferase (sialic acid O-acetyltransferase NeuD family)
VTQSLVIIGCGGFGREVFSIVDALNDNGADWSIAGFADDSPSSDAIAQVLALGSTVLGTVSELSACRTRYGAVLAVGAPSARAAIHQRLENAPLSYPTLVHPASTLGRLVHLGQGCVVAPGARLSTNIRMGRHVHLDQNVTIGHDTTVGDFARINPQACVSGSVHIGDRALVGANATILQGLAIGADAVVGASACVVRDVEPGSTVKGVPAR